MMARGAARKELLLTVASANREKVRSWLATDPVFEPLRGTDAFEELVAG